MRFFRHRRPKFRRGTTLVELMVAMLILAIVCVAWLEIIGIQSARREARRREAVERLAGIMDAFMAVTPKGKVQIAGKKSETNVLKNKYYKIERIGSELSCSYGDVKKAEQFDPEIIKFDASQDLAPIRYQLYVAERDSELFDSNWGSKYWLVGKLYEPEDTLNGVLTDADRAYFTLRVRLWY